jgi:hypothetical protein
MNTTNTTRRQNADARARATKMESCYTERDRHEEGSLLWTEWQARIDELNIAAARAQGFRVG